MWRIIAAVSLLFFVAACSEKRPAPANTETDATQKKEPIGKGEKMAKESEKPTRIDNAFPPQVAGSFYTSNPAELRDEVRGYIDGAGLNPDLKGRDIVGVLAPHAGYMYSGPVAGHAYKAVSKGSYKTIIVMALSHRRPATKVGVLNRPAYDTPLGSLKIDVDVVRALIGKHSDVFDSNEAVFEGEHSLEVQLPFIQVALPGASVVPIIVAVHDDQTIEKAGRALFETLGSRRDVLFVLSSDLSHFFPYDKAVTLDTNMLELLEEWNLDKWNIAASKRSEGMCGHRPIQSFASFFGEYDACKRKVTRLAYKNSGDTAGDKSRVVGYGALAFSLEEGIRMETGGKDFGPFEAEHRKYLIDLAKRAVTAAAKGEKFSPDRPAEKLLADKGAAFVTLKKHGKLRGCIGHVIARIPLFECISDVAKSAAIFDTRFSKVRPDELGELEFEISVLTAPEPTTPEEVVVGRDGLIMSRGGRSGLLLPQVPIEWNWDREEFLSHTCRKAGLPLDCWKDPETKIESFRAIVFGEDDL